MIDADQENSKIALFYPIQVKVYQMVKRKYQRGFLSELTLSFLQANRMVCCQSSRRDRRALHTEG